MNSLRQVTNIQLVAQKHIQAFKNVLSQCFKTSKKKINVQAQHC